MDEPKLELGATVDLKDGAVGIVIALYTPSRHPKKIRYILRVEPEEHRNRKL